jgi:hypothetical protein
VSAPGTSHLEADLRHYLQGKIALFSPQISEVIADVIRFTSAVLRDGFRLALAQLPSDVTVQTTRPFIQVCEAIVEHHVRMVEATERDLVGKALFEAYIHLAGPQHVFRPVTTTRFMHSLRHHGAKSFAASFLSLHLFHVVCLEIQDDVAAKMRDQQAVELYMFGMEAMCRDVVARAMTIPDGDLDKQWAAAICLNIEGQLLHGR